MGLLARRSVVIGLVLAVAGCSGRPPATTAVPYLSISPPVVTTVPSSAQAKDARLPIEAYLLTPSQSQTIYDAATKIVNGCLRSFGFSGDEKPPTADRTTLMDRRYGVTDPADAARYGYHPATGADRKPSAPASMPVGEQGAYDGTVPEYGGRKVPVGGCVGEGRRQSGLDAIARADPGSVVDQISVDSMPAGENDARVKAVLKKWSSCMAAAGYHYDSPVGMADHDAKLAKSFAAPVADAAEIKLATTDVGCKEKYDVVSTWFAVESAYEEVMIKQNAAVLARVSGADTAAVEKSQAILSAG